MQKIIISIANPDPQTCFAGIVCANDTFIAIYGVIFTIVISLGVYIYGLQNKEEKITLLKNTNIKSVIKSSLGFFALSFFALPSPIYEVVNFLFVGWIFILLLGAFNEVFKFNESELSGERAVKKFKEGVIREKLNQFEDLKKKNDLLNEEFEKKRGKEIERFLFSENNESYHLIRAQSSGYITDIDLNILFAKENKDDSSKNSSYYIPYHISFGAPIDFDTVILGVKKEDGKKVDEERLRSFVSISDEYENPTSYIEAETRNYYPEMISLIKIEDAKSLELKLKEFSSFVDHFVAKEDSYVDIIQFINDDIIFTLQKYAFKQGNVDCIRKVVSFSLGYVYQALDKKSVKTFNIFFRNLGHAFYESFNLQKKERDEFLDIYFRWINEVAKYSLKSKLQKDKDYLEFVITFLSGVNGWLKIAFDHKDIDVFSKTLSFLNDSFSREDYERNEDNLLDEAVLTKKAVIFGFSSWVYKDFPARKGDDFYRNALSQLLSALRKDPVYYYANNEDDLNYYLSLYLKSAELSESKGSFGWDSWGMPEGRVYTITIRQDIKNLLADRILSIFAHKRDGTVPAVVIDIKNKNYNDELALIKQGNQQFDVLFNKTRESFVSTESLTDEQFDAVKVKFYEVFSEISKKYESDVRSKLIEQSIDDDKFNEFVKQNFESYKKSRVLYGIQRFIKDDTKKSDGFGYNTLLLKEQFVKETNVHYTNEGQFGENLARSEDNKLLETIHNKFKKISSINEKKISQAIDGDAVAVVLWLNGYLSLESSFPDDFVPYWREADSREEKGHYYQGTFKGVPVFIVYKFDEQKSYKDSMFVFRQDAFSVHEFEIEKDTELDEANTKSANDSDACLVLSVTNISNLDEARKKIVENWVEKGLNNVQDKDAEIEKLKTSVIFKFYKGLSVDGVVIDEEKIKVFHIKKSSTGE